MKNKTVIRKELISGKFTSIHNSILFDTRLSPIAYRLLTAILSDSDTKFNLSQSLYLKKLGITKPTFLKAITNLQECGYLRKDENKISNKLHFYIISEYGNLNKKEDLIHSEPEIKTDFRPIEEAVELVFEPKQNKELTQVVEIAITQPIFKLEDYTKLIICELDKSKYDIDVEGMMYYFIDSFNTGKLNNKSQMTVENINKIINKFITNSEQKSSTSPSELTESDIKLLCESYKEKVTKTKYKEFVNACIMRFNSCKRNGTSTNKFHSQNFLSF